MFHKGFIVQESPRMSMKILFGLMPIYTRLHQIKKECRCCYKYMLHTFRPVNKGQQRKSQTLSFLCKWSLFRGWSVLFIDWDFLIIGLYSQDDLNSEATFITGFGCIMIWRFISLYLRAIRFKALIWQFTRPWQ